MSIFNPIKDQYQALCRAMDDRKVLLLKNAATAMNVKPEKVDHSLMIMTRKGMFGNNAPYVEDVFGLVVLDKRYANYAAVFAAEESLFDMLENARRAPHVLANRRRQEQRTRPMENVGGFVRDLVEGYSKGVRGTFRDAAVGFVRNAVNVNNTPGLDTQGVEEAFARLQANCREMKSILYAYPDHPYAPDLADWMNQLAQKVLAWIGCLEAADGKGQKGSTMQELEDYFTNSALAEFNQQLELYRGNRRPDSEDTTLMQEVFSCTSELRTCRNQTQNFVMSAALQQIISLLQDITRSVGDDKLQLSRSAVNSLRSTYLPMTRKLTQQYVQNERIANPDEVTKKAMRETEKVLSQNVPVALQRILDEMRHGGAINMESDAIALKQKLHMDGLL